jgi:hypothetical protein
MRDRQIALTHFDIRSIGIERPYLLANRTILHAACRGPTRDAARGAVEETGSFPVPLDCGNHGLICPRKWAKMPVSSRAYRVL